MKEPFLTKTYKEVPKISINAGTDNEGHGWYVYLALGDTLSTWMLPEEARALGKRLIKLADKKNFKRKKK